MRWQRYAVFTVLHTTHTRTPTHPQTRTGRPYTYIYTRYALNTQAISANRFVEKLFVGVGCGGATNGV